MKSDEEIFADKEKEIQSLKETINDLENKCAMTSRYLEQAYSKEKEQSELMLQMQMHIESLMAQATYNNPSNLNEYDESISGEGDGKQFFQMGQSTQRNSNLPPDPKQRAKTAPVNNKQNQDEEAINSENQSQQNQDQRKHNKRPGVHSSPAVFSLDRVMQSFRARTQLLAEALEENDEVLQVKIEPDQDTKDVDTNGLIENMDSEDNEEKFVKFFET